MWMEVLMMERRDKVNYYLDLADVVSQRGTCLRKRYGAVIVKNDEFYFFILWIIIFSRKNCVYSFFCCSFYEQLYTGFWF